MCTNVFTKRIDIDYSVYFMGLQYHMVYKNMTLRIKESHPVNGRFVMFIYPRMLCKLNAMADFVMHIFVLGRTATLSQPINMGNGTVSSLFLIR